MNMNSDSNKAFNISRPITPTIKKPTTEARPHTISKMDRASQAILTKIPKIAEQTISTTTNGKQQAQSNK